MFHYYFHSEREKKKKRSFPREFTLFYITLLEPSCFRLVYISVPLFSSVNFPKSNTKRCGEDDQVTGLDPNVPSLGILLEHCSKMCQRPQLEQQITSHMKMGLHYPEQINCSQCDWWSWGESTKTRLMLAQYFIFGNESDLLLFN